MANIHGIEVSGETYNLEDTTARNGVQTNTSSIDDIKAVVPSSVSPSNKLVTQNDVPDISSLETAIEDIQSVIPASATAQNQLMAQSFSEVANSIVVNPDFNLSVANSKVLKNGKLALLYLFIQVQEEITIPPKGKISALSLNIGYSGSYIRTAVFLEDMSNFLVADIKSNGDIDIYNTSNSSITINSSIRFPPLALVVS